MMKHRIVRIAIFVLAVIGTLTTIAGGVGILTGAIAFPLEYLQGSPFVDYTIPGLALAILVGGCFLFAAVTIFTGREMGVLASALAGLFMIGFEVVEIAVVDRSVGNWLSIAVVLQAIFSVLGLAIFGLATYLWMAEYRSLHFPSRHVSHA
jgi:hypothetical protein